MYVCVNILLPYLLWHLHIQHSSNDKHKENTGKSIPIDKQKLTINYDHKRKFTGPG